MAEIEYRPEPSEFAWTFGGAPPVRKVKPVQPPEDDYEENLP